MDTSIAQSTTSESKNDDTSYAQTLDTFRYLIMAGARRYISDEMLGDAIQTQKAEEDWDTVELLESLVQVQDVSDEDMRTANQHIDCGDELCYSALFLNLVVDVVARINAADEQISTTGTDEIMEQTEDLD